MDISSHSCNGRRKKPHIALSTGETFQEPSDNEPIPAGRETPLTSPPPSDVIHKVAGPNQMAPLGDTAANAQISKRGGAPLAAPSTQGARTSRDANDSPKAAPPDQFGIPAWKDRTILLDVTQDDLEQATRFPLHGVAGLRAVVFGSGGVPLSHSICDTAPRRNMAFGRSFKRQAGTDPVSVALADARAVLTDQKDFRAPDDWGEPEFPLLNSHFQIDKLPERRARAHPNVYNP